MDEIFDEADMHMEEEVDPHAGAPSGPTTPLGLAFPDHYPPLSFPQRTTARTRCQKYLRMTFGRQRCVHWPTLQLVGEYERAISYVGEDSPWRRLFDGAEVEAHRELTVEFLSTFEYRPRPADFVEPPVDQPQPPAEVSFRIFGQEYGVSLARFAVLTGLYYEPETVTPLYTEALRELPRDELAIFWGSISHSALDEHGKGRVSTIRDPLFRYLHRLIAKSIGGRALSNEWCTASDMFFLYCLLRRRPCQLAHLLAQYWGEYHRRQTRGHIVSGRYVTRSPVL